MVDIKLASNVLVELYGGKQAQVVFAEPHKDYLGRKCVTIQEERESVAAFLEKQVKKLNEHLDGCPNAGCQNDSWKKNEDGFCPVCTVTANLRRELAKLKEALK